MSSAVVLPQLIPKGVFGDLNELDLGIQNIRLRSLPVSLRHTEISLRLVWRSHHTLCFPHPQKLSVRQYTCFTYGILQHIL